jgi:ABC-type glutathione transport system ATPase component
MSAPDSADAQRNETPLLEVRGLCVRFPVDVRDPERGEVQAVEGVSLDLYAGETLALVGESGCGKSTLARAICGIDRIHSGSVKLHGHELAGRSRRALREQRRALPLIFE